MKVPTGQPTRKNRVMEIFDIFTVCLLLASTTTFLYTFLLAYFNGMTVQVTINEHGEAIPELALLIITIPCGVVTLVRMFRRLG